MHYNHPRLRSRLVGACRDFEAGRQVAVGKADGMCSLVDTPASWTVVVESEVWHFEMQRWTFARLVTAHRIRCCVAILLSYYSAFQC